MLLGIQVVNDAQFDHLAAGPLGEGVRGRFLVILAGGIVAGDGGFQFTLPELSVAIEQQLSIPILLWNNNGYAQIKQGMVNREMPVLGVDMHNPDFVALAEAYGAKGVRPTSLAEFEEAIQKALVAGGPTIIDIEQEAEWVIAAGRAL